MSSQDDIFDALTRHQIFVLRYARGRELEAERFIAGTLNEVINRLEEQPLTAFGRARLQNQARDLYEYLRESGSSYAQSLRNDMVRFGGYEAAFNQRVLQNNLQIDIGIPSPMQIQQAAFLEIMGLEPSQGYTLGGMVDEFGERNATIIFNTIRQAAVLGDTTDDLIRYIREIEPMQKRKAATLARTAVNHVAVQARTVTLKENDDVLLGYEWVATLDSRTSLICMSRDGVIYKDYDKDPKPPAHFNCRSTITPVVNPIYDLGKDIVGKRPAKGSAGTKVVSADLNYNDWLKRQSSAFQDKVLGKGRAKLFRAGMPVTKFVDDRGRTLTLRELGELDRDFNASSVQDILDRLDELGGPIKPPKGPNLTTFSKPRQPQGEVRITPADQVRILEAEQAKTRLKNWVQNNAKDERHFAYTRFSGRSYFPAGDWKEISKLDDDVARGFESCIDDMDALCDLFNVPRLKGILPINSGSTIANMGDATMGLNNNQLRRLLLGLDDKSSFAKIREINQWTKKTRKSAGKTEWARGRPWTIDDFLDNDYDRARSTFFHELGHHIHQMYKTQASQRYYGADSTPIELLMVKKYGKYTTSKRHSPSRYGDKNTKEWFAENFSAYFMNKRDKVDDLFLDLIESMMKGAYP